MKKLFKKSKNEHGAIALISVFVLLVAVMFMALIVDGGLLYYRSAKLQNAVDAAAIGVAHHIGSSEATRTFYAEEYLDKNGFPREKYADKWKIDIKMKSVLNESETIDDEEYISSGMIRLNVQIEDKSLIGTFSGIESLKLNKTGYAKANANYVKTPRALNYTIFGADGSASDDGTVSLEGKTGDFSNVVVGVTQEVINGINNKIVQPIIGFFGGETNYNDLVHMNTSEIITNGDVHSNSNIMIGVQALNASRTMDAEYNGTIKRNGVDKNIVFGDSVEEESNDYSDYGQVTFTAVNSGADSRTITFNNTFSNSNNANLTHLYVQNQQYLEITQLVLNAINSIADFSALGTNQDVLIDTSGPTDSDGFNYTGLNNNGTIFLAGVDKYLQSETAYYDKKEELLTDKGKTAKQKIVQQAIDGNISVADSGKLYLKNQHMIVYDVSHKTARTLLDEVCNEGLSTAKKNADKKIDTTEVFTGVSDSSDEIDYDVKYKKTSAEGVIESQLDAGVLGTRISRDVENVPSSVSDNVTAGMKYALAMTFMEDTEYIDVPNMKPYFVRQIKNSIYNASTQTHKDNLGNTVYDEAGSTSVKKVVKNASDKLEGINEKTYYTDQTYANYNYDEHTENIDLDSLEVTSFNYSAAGNKIFSEYKRSSNSGITDLTSGSVSYTTTDWTMNKKGMSTYADGTPKDRNWTMSSTQFKGYNIKNSDGSLRNSHALIGDFANEHINADVENKNQVLYGVKAIEQYKKFYVDADDDHDDWKDNNGNIKSDLSDVKGDYQKHSGADAVAKKRAYLTQNVSFEGVSTKFSNFINYAPEIKDVFLKSGSVIESNFKTAIEAIKNKFDELEFTLEPSGSRRDDVDEPNVPDADDSDHTTAGSANIGIDDPADSEKKFTFNKVISADGITNGGATDKEKNYFLEDLFPGYDGVYGKDDDDNNTTVLYAINEFIANNTPKKDSLVNKISSLAEQGATESNNIISRCESSQSSFPSGSPRVLTTGKYYGSWSNTDASVRIVTSAVNRMASYNQTSKKRSLDICGGTSTDLTYLLVDGDVKSTKGDITIGSNTLNTPGNAVLVVGGNLTLQDYSIILNDNCSLYVMGNISLEHANIKIEGTNCKVYCAGYVYSVDNSTLKNYPSYFNMGDNSHFAVAGDFKGARCHISVGDDDTFVVGGELDNNNISMSFGSNTSVYVSSNFAPGDSSTDNNCNIGDNSFVYIGGNFRVNNKKQLNIGTGTRVIVRGELDATEIKASKTSIIYANSLNGGNASYTHNISNFLCPTNVTIYGGLTLTENANVFVNGNFTVEKTFTLYEGDRLAIWGQPTFGTLSKGDTITDIGFYAYGDYGNDTFNLDVPKNGAYCFNNFTAKSVNIQGDSGQFCVTNKCKVYGDITNANLAYLGDAEITGKVTNYGDMHITDALSPESIENTGYLRVDGNISTSGEISTAGVEASFIVSGSVGASDNKVSKFTNVGRTAIEGNLYVSGEVINGNPEAPDTVSILYIGNEKSTDHDNSGNLVAASLSNYYQARAVHRIDVTGDIYNGGQLRATNAITCANFESKSKAQSEYLTVSGDAKNTGTLVCRVISITGTLTNGNATSNATVSANTSITVGNISYSKNMYVAGNLTFTGTNTTFPMYNTYIMGSIVAGNGASSRPEITVENILKVDGGISASSFTTQENSNTVISGTLSVYSPNGISSIVNNGNIKIGGDLSADGDNTSPATGTVAGNATITNKNIIKTVNVNCKTLINNGEDINVKQATLLATGYIKVDGDLTNGAPRHRTDVIYTRQYLYVNGNILNYAQIGVNGADDSGYAVIVTGDISLYNTMSYPNGNILHGGTFDDNIVSDTIYIAKDDNVIITKDSAETLLSETKVIEVDGNLLIDSDVTNEINGLIIGGGTVYCKSRNLSLKYLNIDKTGTFSTAAKSILGKSYVTVTETITADSFVSVKSDGYCYIDGDLSSAGTVEAGGGEFYTNGDVSVGSTAHYGRDALHMMDYSKVYINGNISSTTQNGVTIDESNDTGASVKESVLSIYGYGHASGLGTGSFVLQNNQPEASVYLGTGTDSETLWKTNPITIGGQGELHNYGNMYVYGCLTNVLSWSSDTNNCVFKNQGGTYIAGYFTTNCNQVSVSNNHTFVCDGYYTAPKTVVNDANLYLMSGISLTSNFEIIDGSFFAAEATGFDYESSRVSYTNSTIYLPKPERDGTLKYSDLVTKSNKGITGIITEANLQIDADATVASNTTLYVGGTTEFEGSYNITNNGNMYLMGKIDISKAKSNPFVFKDGSDSYIGPTSTGTLNYNAFLEQRGNLYVENNLIVNGNNGSSTVGNRYASLVAYGNMFVLGDVTTQTGQGVLINNGASFSNGGSFTVGSTIYNYGKFIVNGDLIVVDNDYVTDKKESKSKDASAHHQGISIKNGAGEADTSAQMYIGGTQRVDFYGVILNGGKLYMNCTIGVQGWTNSGYGIKGDQAFVNYNKAKANFAGNVYLNSNELYNRQDAEFGCGGDLYFGTCLVNLGKVVAAGKITNNEAGYTINTIKYSDGGSKSIMNGCDLVNYDSYDKHVYPNALLYCGGDMHLGVTQTGGEAGSYISFGTTYVGGSMLDYTNTDNSFYKTALWLMNNSNTFIGGDCFGGGGILTGNNSILMCDGDYISKRSTKINVNTFMYYYATVGVVNHTLSCNDDDNFTPAYFYVGGNMFANVLGKVIWDYNTLAVTSGENRTPQNYSRDLDIYSNTNIFVGGSLEVNAKVYMRQNVNCIVAGAKKINDTSTYMILGYEGNETVFNYIFNAITDSGTRSALRALNDAGYFGKNPDTFYSAQLLDQNICSTFVVNGNSKVIGTTKIRDMAKTYIYGSFYSRDYVELGKALDGDDETEAKENGFFVKGVDSKEGYSFSRAAYMYVGGNYQCGGSQQLGKDYQELTGVLATLTFNSVPTKIFASSTLKVKGSFLTTGYLTLRHDANIYTGRSLAAYKSIDVGSYSGVYINGNCEAITSTVKIRDQVECVINGDLTALNAYIELGKQGDYDRGKAVTVTVSEGSIKETCDCCVNCTDNVFCECGCDNCKWKNGTDTQGGNAADEDETGVEEVDKTVASDMTKIADVSSEIEADGTDTAYGSKFYIGGRIMSYNQYNGYIKIYGYSQVIVGKYVFTPQYLTLRHNADLWVLPEMFGNITYKYKPYVSNLTDDARLWDILVDKIREFNYELKEATKFKEGSVYSLGQLTMNKNSSIMGSYDCFVLGQTNLMADTLVYMGHDFSCYAPSVNLSSVMDRIGWELEGKSGEEPAISVTGFTSQGSAKQAVRMVCTNREEHGGKNYSMRVLYKNYDSSKTYKCDRCGADLEKKYFDVNNEVSHPITVYADNDISLFTTVTLSSTYLVTNKGNVNVSNVYSTNECHCCDACTHDSSCQCTCDNCICDVDLRSLPNAIASYQGNINYSALYNKISALFYAPTGGKNADGEETGVVKLDGFYQEIWGSIIGNRVKCNSFYMALHRFQNWRTLNLHLAEAGNVYIISEKEFNNAADMSDEDDEYDITNLKSDNPGGADMFFSKDVIDSVHNSTDDDE